jgi:phosphoglycolate phosphatase
MAKFAAVVFDLDGTLLNTLEDIADCMNVVLEGEGYSSHPYDAYKTMVGSGVVRLLERACPESVSDEALHARCLERFREVYSVGHDIKTRPYDGIVEMLDALQEAGIRIGVLSNKPHRYTVPMVDQYFPGIAFDLALGARDGVPKKPDPQALVEMMDAMSSPADGCLYVGDTDVDMQTAVAAGAVPGGVLWGFRDRAELEGAGAVHLFVRPQEIVSLMLQEDLPDK